MFKTNNLSFKDLYRSLTARRVYHLVRVTLYGHLSAGPCRLFHFEDDLVQGRWWEPGMGDYVFSLSLLSTLNMRLCDDYRCREVGVVILLC